MGIQVGGARNPRLDDGVWGEFKGSRFLIRHTSNMKFQRELQRLQAPYKKAIEKGNMDPEDQKNIVCAALATCILIGWDEVTDQNKQPVAYSAKLAKQSLLNDEALREYVQEYSTDLANFREEEIEEKGND